MSLSGEPAAQTEGSEKKLIMQAGAPVFGRETEQIEAHEMESISADPATVEHVARHLSKISQPAVDRLSSEWTDNTRTLDTQALLDTAGSKFDNSLDDPYKLVEFARTAATRYVENNKVNWIEVQPGFEKADLSIQLSSEDKGRLGMTSETKLGSSGVTPLTPELESLKKVEERGRTDADRINVNVVYGKPLAQVDELVITLKRQGGKVGLITMHPGPVAPPLPWKAFPDEARKAYAEYWDRHTFLKP